MAHRVPKDWTLSDIRGRMAEVGQQALRARDAYGNADRRYLNILAEFHYLERKHDALEFRLIKEDRDAQRLAEIEADPIALAAMVGGVAPDGKEAPAPWDGLLPERA